MPRGGKRNGTPGKAYANRTDLSAAQAIKSVPGQSYGVAQQQREAQSVVPVAGTPMPSPSAGAPAPGGAGAPAPSGPMPGELGPLGAPSGRPGEPVTTGLPVGAGAGIEALGGAMEANSVRLQLQAIYSRFPTEQLRQLLENLDDEEG